MQSVFANWPWWVFENSPVKFVDTMFSSFLLEGNKVSLKQNFCFLQKFVTFALDTCEVLSANII